MPSPNMAVHKMSYVMISKICLNCVAEANLINRQWSLDIVEHASLQFHEAILGNRVTRLLPVRQFSLAIMKNQSANPISLPVWPAPVDLFVLTCH